MSTVIACSAQAAANYVISKFKLYKSKLSKTKLQCILVCAHLDAVADNKSVLSESLNLMHFGFVIKSLASDLIRFSYDEDLSNKISKNHLSGDIRVESRDVLTVIRYLDAAISKMEKLPDKECIRMLNGPKSLWHYIAFELYKGNHLIDDYTKISDKMLYVSISRLLDSNFKQDSSEQSS